MFKKFQYNITAIIMGILAIFFICILVAIYAISYQNNINHADYALWKLCKSEGFDMLKYSNGSKYNPSIYYLVLLGTDQSVVKIANDNNSGYTNKELGNLAISLSQKEERRGKVGDLSYIRVVRRQGTYFAFVNYSLLNDYYKTLLYTIIVVGCVGLIILLVFSIWLSRWLVSPVETAFKKQKQFISNASHELKTPITIISSNADALEREIGKSKWIDYIRNETTRLSSLVNDLLQLAAIDTFENRNTYTKLNLSELVMSITLPFESVAYEKQINLEEEIEGNVFTIGDNTKLGQLIAILIDNAFNYTEMGGNVTVKLCKHMDKKIITVTNTGKEIPASERELIFERFYRIDEARTRDQGNYGLGLAIAKSITLSHDGKISVSCKNNVTKFKVVL